jgi:hypothetical protein
MYLKNIPEKERKKTWIALWNSSRCLQTVFDFDKFLLVFRSLDEQCQLIQQQPGRLG